MTERERTRMRVTGVASERKEKREKRKVAALPLR
jgi:hypothetical protein